MGAPAARARHQWREVGRLPVSLIRHVCACGCGKQMIRLQTDDGRAIAFKVPSFGPTSVDGLRKVSGAVELGRELLALLERVKAAVG